jgi:hypothetical protein
VSPREMCGPAEEWNSETRSTRDAAQSASRHLTCDCMVKYREFASV